MRTRLLATTLAMAVCMMGVSAAYAAEAAPAPMKNVSVTGKAIFKSETKDGKVMKDYSLTVVTAREANGKLMADLAGKTLKVTGSHTGDIEKLADKEAIVRGTLSADKASLEADSVMARPVLHHSKKIEVKKEEAKKK